MQAMIQSEPCVLIQHIRLRALAMGDAMGIYELDDELACKIID